MENLFERCKNRNKYVLCNICSKSVRSDNFNRHSKIHKNIMLKMDEEPEAIHINEKHYQILDEGREKINKNMEETLENLRVDLLNRNQVYLEKIELGKNIAGIIDEGVVQEDSLTKERKLALELYRKQKPRFVISNVKLRPWQEQAIALIYNPSERQIIWVTGRKGNEGKTWFQCYMESYFGFHRVVRVDLRIKHENVCNVLKKRSLGAADIFLFNDSRSVSGEELNLY